MGSAASSFAEGADGGKTMDDLPMTDELRRVVSHRLAAVVARAKVLVAVWAQSSEPTRLDRQAAALEIALQDYDAMKEGIGL